MLYAYTLVLYIMKTHNSLVRNDNNLNYGSSLYLGGVGVCSSTIAALLYMMEYNTINDPRTNYVLLK